MASAIASDVRRGARRRRVVLGAALLASSLVRGPRAAADTSGASPMEAQLAQNLFDDGRRLMDQGDYAHACPKLAESQKLDPGGGTLLNLALCHEKQGKLASAFAELNASLSMAIRDGRKDRIEIARARLAVVGPLVDHLTVTVAPGADVEGLEVRLDGELLARPAWGTPLGVDPGAHHVRATAPGTSPWEAVVNFDRRAQDERVEVPRLAPESGVSIGCAAGTVLRAGACVPSASPAPKSAPPPLPSAPPPSYRTRPSVVFWSLTGLTVASFVTSTVTGVLAINAHSKFQDACPNPDRQYCTDAATARDAADSGRTYAWVSTVSLGVGLVAGATLFFIPARDRVAVAPQVGLGPGGATVGLQGRLP